MATYIRELIVQDIRFPTSLEADGSDAMHTDPDYSCAYVTLLTDTDMKGFGFSFTIGRGTEIVVAAIKSMAIFVVGQKLKSIFDDFGTFVHGLSNDTQMRWIGPEKGVIHLATAAILNALWDLWAKLENKPLWKLVADLEPEKLVSVIDFSYISDVITKEEALEILKRQASGKKKREEELLLNGYSAYTTQVGWLGYSNEKIKMLCKQFMAAGFTHFKVKVGQDLEDDKRRCKVVRDCIGWQNVLMVDANQRWEVHQAIEWMKELKDFKIYWIEEPTSPDDILGHADIAKAVNQLGILVATGEQCHNRVMFKQFLKAGGMQICQIDSCRLGGVNEVLAVLLMAHKLNVKVCPHAGGVGLCELVQHLAMIDYICISGSKKDRVVEYVGHLHEHFIDPVVIKNACYMPPQIPGYSSEMKSSSIEDYQYPDGKQWRKLFDSGIFKKP